MKIICIGRNYADHAKELNNPLPKEPLVFMKPPTALLLEGKAFYIPAFTDDVHYELEVVLKICKNGRHVQPEFASGYYEEIGLGIDMTARDIQQKCKEKGHPWEIAKAFDHSAVIGSFCSKEQFVDNRILFSLNKNGETVQKGDTQDLIFSFDYIIQYVSKYFKLQMGDLIFTGTPAGVGPIKKGDVLEGFVGEDRMLRCEIR